MLLIAITVTLYICVGFLFADFLMKFRERLLAEHVQATEGSTLEIFLNQKIFMVAWAATIIFWLFAPCFFWLVGRYQAHVHLRSAANLQKQRL